MIVSEEIRSFLIENNMFFYWVGVPDIGHHIDAGSTFEVEESIVLNGNLIPKKFGFMSYTNSRLHYGCEIGRYCSIAANVRIMGAAHPTNLFTTSPVVYNKDFKLLSLFLEKQNNYKSFEFIEHDESAKPFTTGHDVWIGEDVLIAHGIHIGHGAIIAARSVVTKDVPAYSIVAGAPAIVKKYRFNEKTIEKIIKLRWWDYNIIDFNDLFNNNISYFIDGFYEKLYRKEISVLTPKVFTEKTMENLLNSSI